MDAPRTIEVSAEQYQRLEREAARMGLTVSAYVAFLSASRQHLPSQDLVDAISFLHKGYPNTLKKLAQ